jgi:metal-dependent hydrolase (beta-lactamase superfamily II)
MEPPEAIPVICRLYQGGRQIEEENARDFGFDPAEIDIVLLSHAHLDHCGRLPLLTRRRQEMPMSSCPNSDSPSHCDVIWLGRARVTGSHLP